MRPDPAEGFRRRSGDRPPAADPQARRRGVVLLLVLFFVLLLTSGVTRFVQRSLIDATIVRNREDLRQAENLARGGVRIAEALLSADRRREAAGEQDPLDTLAEPWARIGGIELNERGGDLQELAAGGDSGIDARFSADGILRLHIEDAGGRLNLNALFESGEEGDRNASENTETFLQACFEKWIDELPLPPGEKALYDPLELAQALIDWIDSDELTASGGDESERYARRTPPTTVPNRPLLSVDELRAIDGFDELLIETMRPYVGVHPFAPYACGEQSAGCGINPNTAPPHVLALLYYDDGVEYRLADEDVVSQILEIREEGGSICPEGMGHDGCVSIREIVPNAIFPLPTFSSSVFRIESEARSGEARSRIETILERSDPDHPRLLSWRAD